MQIVMFGNSVDHKRDLANDVFRSMERNTKL